MKYILSATIAQSVTDNTLNDFIYSDIRHSLLIDISDMSNDCQNVS